MARNVTWRGDSPTSWNSKTFPFLIYHQLIVRSHHSTETMKLVLCYGSWKTPLLFGRMPSGKLTQQWKAIILNTRYIFKWWISHCYALYWLFSSDPYNGLLYSPPNSVVESPIYPKQLGFFHCSNHKFLWKNGGLLAGTDLPLTTGQI